MILYLVFTYLLYGVKKNNIILILMFNKLNNLNFINKFTEMYFIQLKNS